MAAGATTKVGLDRVHELLSVGQKARQDHSDIPRARCSVLVALAQAGVGTVQGSGCGGLDSREAAVRDKEAGVGCGAGYFCHCL